MLDAYYGSQDKYLSALSRELKNEYQAIHKAGLILQIDAPDLAMDRTMMYRDLSEPEFVKAVERHVRRSTTALPAFRASACGCTSATATGKARTSTISR